MQFLPPPPYPEKLYALMHYFYRARRNLQVCIIDVMCPWLEKITLACKNTTDCKQNLIGLAQSLSVNMIYWIFFCLYISRCKSVKTNSEWNWTCINLNQKTFQWKLITTNSQSVVNTRRNRRRATVISRRSSPNSTPYQKYGIVLCCYFNFLLCNFDLKI